MKADKVEFSYEAMQIIIDLKDNILKDAIKQKLEDRHIPIFFCF